MFAIIAILIAAFDSNMSAEDLIQTGVSKLSMKEKEALQTWIDSKYLKKTGKKKQLPVLQENLKGGSLIGLTDCSLWEINPADTPITQGWISAVEIKIEQSSNIDYPYKLTNSLTGSAVRARKQVK